jgi:hypothetical protein
MVAMLKGNAKSQKRIHNILFITVTCALILGSAGKAAYAFLIIKEASVTIVVDENGKPATSENLLR